MLEVEHSAPEASQKIHCIFTLKTPNLMYGNMGLTTTVSIKYVLYPVQYSADGGMKYKLRILKYVNTC